MDWTVGLIVGCVILALWVLRRRGLVGPEPARKLLRDGALVVDVRSAAEFAARHLPGAINAPLGELAAVMPRRVPDKNAVLLLHCLSGGRSAIAKSRLKGLGYPHVYNLGSYGRAEAIVRQARVE